MIFMVSAVITFGTLLHLCVLLYAEGSQQHSLRYMSKQTWPDVIIHSYCLHSQSNISKLFSVVYCQQSALCNKWLFFFLSGWGSHYKHFELILAHRNPTGPHCELDSFPFFSLKIILCYSSYPWW